MRTFAVIWVLAFTAGSTLAAPSVVQPAAEDEGGIGGLIDTVNDVYPIVLDDNLEPEVDDRLVIFWVVSSLCGQACGPLWIPMVVVGEDPGSDYFVTEAVFAILFELLTVALGGVSTSVGGLGMVLIMIHLVYLLPVGIINTYDRALKRQRAKLKSGSVGVRGPPAPPDLVMAF